MLSTLSNYVQHSFTNNERSRRTQASIDLLANVLSGYDPTNDNYHLLIETVKHTVLVEDNIYRISIGWIDDRNHLDENLNNNDRTIQAKRLQTYWCSNYDYVVPHLPHIDRSNESFHCETMSTIEHVSEMWLSDRLNNLLQIERYYQHDETKWPNDTSEWSDIFYDCDVNRWFIAYQALILEVDNKVSNQNETDSIDSGQWYVVKGVIIAHVDVTETDINQCEDTQKIILNNDSTNQQWTMSSDSILYRVAHQHQSIPFSSTFHPQHQTEQSSAIESIENVDLIELARSLPNKRKLSRFVFNLYGTHKCHIQNSKVSSFH